jgi:DNA-binding protein YbaB
MNLDFQKLVPYLKDPLVLIGFFLLLAFSLSRYLIKKGIIGKLPPALSFRILRVILLYGFITGLLLIILGFVLKHQELVGQQRTAESIELMLRDALKNVSSWSEEKKNEIVTQILQGYRSGALSKEQIEKKVEEINISLTQNLDHTLETRPSPTQLHIDKVTETKTTIPPPPTPYWAGNSSESKKSIRSELDTEKQSTSSSSGKRDSPSTNEVRNTVATLLPVGPTLHDRTMRGFDVKIDDPPRDGIDVGRGMKVKVTALLPPGYHLWVLTRRSDFEDVWWPQGEGAWDPRTHEWVVSVTFGGPQDIGWDFEIEAIVVKDQARAVLEAYITKAMNSGKYNPIELPSCENDPRPVRIVKKVSND